MPIRFLGSTFEKTCDAFRKPNAHEAIQPGASHIQTCHLPPIVTLVRSAAPEVELVSDPFAVQDLTQVLVVAAEGILFTNCEDAMKRTQMAQQPGAGQVRQKMRWSVEVNF